MNLIRYQVPELSNWTPYDRLSTLRDEFNRLFEWPVAQGNGRLFSGWSPALDVFDEKDHLVVKLELPGMKKEEIEISLHEGALTVSGERKQESKETEGETFRSERYVGKFQRSVTLPTPVDGNHVKASYQDGVLTVELPKTEEAKPKRIEVSVS